MRTQARPTASSTVRDFMGRNLADLAIAAYRRIAAARS
jgi:hypothetical protein